MQLQKNRYNLLNSILTFISEYYIPFYVYNFLELLFLKIYGF